MRKKNTSIANNPFVFTKCSVSFLEPHVCAMRIARMEKRVEEFACFLTERLKARLSCCPDKWPIPPVRIAESCHRETMRKRLDAVSITAEYGS